MNRRALTSCLAIAASLCAAGATLAQPARVPVSALGPPAEPLAGHPYKSALGAAWNYQSCGANAQRASVLSVNAELQSIEAAARAKGLGPILERLRRELEALMAVSDMMACAHGPSIALVEARQALAAFRAWVAAQPRMR